MRKTKYIVMGVVLFCSCFLTSNALEIDQIKSQYIYVYNFNKDEVLYEKNAQEKMYPASMTKIMTTLVALENIDYLEEKITLEARVFEGLTAAEASVAGYSPHDEASLIDLLYGIMLPSGADAARAIAFHVAGSEEAYVQLMNDKAKKLGLEHTHFVNTSGLYDDDHYSTAEDIGIMLKEALKNEIFVKIFHAESYRGNPTNAYPNGIPFQTTRSTAIYNAGLEPGLIEGSKTGFTLESGLCMASTARRDGAYYMVVTGQAGTDVDGAQHILDAYTIYHQLFDTYENKVIYNKNAGITTVNVRFGEAQKVEVYAKEDITAFSEKNVFDMSVSFLKETLQAPVQKGEQVATLVLSQQGKEVKRIKLYALKEVPRNGIAYLLFWSILMILVLLALLCIILIINRIRLHRRRKKQRLK